MGVVVLATNHPEKLDPSILDRPSRFDRKYYFHLPAAAERSDYVARWNRELQAELRPSEQIAAELVRQTEGFSFAYMKELFLSSMMQFISTPGTRMDEIILAQAAQLRQQMAATTQAPAVEN